MSVYPFFFIQKTHLNKSIEKFLSHVEGANWMHNAKEEMRQQLVNFDIVVDCCGFFVINRRSISTVSIQVIYI